MTVLKTLKQTCTPTINAFIIGLGLFFVVHAQIGCISTPAEANKDTVRSNASVPKGALPDYFHLDFDPTNTANIADESELDSMFIAIAKQFIDYQKADQEALNALYSATQGPHWTNNSKWDEDKDWFSTFSEWQNTDWVTLGRNVFWSALRKVDVGGDFSTHYYDFNAPPPYCDNFGVECTIIRYPIKIGAPTEYGNDIEIGSVSIYRATGLELPKNNLVSIENGTFPETVQGADQLRYLRLAGNELKYDISQLLSVIANVSNLTELDLDSNKITGRISEDDVYRFVATYDPDDDNSPAFDHPLHTLKLGLNKIEQGELPFAFISLDLKSVDLADCKIRGFNGKKAHLGDIFEILGSNIVELDLSDNDFVLEALPTMQSWGYFPHLESLELNGVNIKDSPKNLAAWFVHPNIEDMSDEHAALSSIQNIGMEDNELMGAFLKPDVKRLAKHLPDLKALMLSNNYLAGEIRPEFANFEQLCALWLDGNPALHGKRYKEAWGAGGAFSQIEVQCNNTADIKPTQAEVASQTSP